MMTIFTFVGTFSLLFFGPIFIMGGSKSRNHSDNFENNPLYKFLIFTLENPTFHIGTGIFVAIGYNIYLLFKNGRFSYLSAIRVDDKIVELGVSNMYFQKTKWVSIPIADLMFEINSVNYDTGVKKSTLRLKNKDNKKVLAILKPKHILWTNQTRDIRNALIELEELGVTKTTKGKQTKSVASSMFKRY